MIFQILLIYFGKFSLKIWPLFGLFHHLRIWPFFETAYGPICPFYFLGPGSPGLNFANVTREGLKLEKLELKKVKFSSSQPCGGNPINSICSKSMN
jgi:hypothetical protein